MALDYTGAGTGVFRHLGKLVKHYNLYQDEAVNPSTGLDADRNEIYDAFEAGDVENVLDGFAGDVERWKIGYVDRRAVLARFMLARLQDRSTVLEEIGAVSRDLREITYRLIDQMNADSQSVLASAVAVGSVSAAVGNVGNGVLVVTKVLDGFSSPGSRAGMVYPSHPAYNGLDSELAVPSETMILECSEDSYEAGGVVSFEWRGKISDSQGVYGIEDEGSGSVGTVLEAHEATADIIENADFEEFTVPNTPDGWVIDGGTAGTHIKSSAVAANVAHGERSLNLVGDGALAQIQLSQPIASSAVQTNRRFVLSAQLKADASISSGTLTIQCEGTGYTPATSEKIELAAGVLPTSLTLNTCFVTMPSSIPSDFRLVVKWSGTPSATKNLYIDDIALAPVTYGGGVGVAVVRGTNLFAKRDRFSFAVTNTEGVFQRSFRQVFGVQLPSASSGNTIGDALAQ